LTTKNVPTAAGDANDSALIDDDSLVGTIGSVSETDKCVTAREIAAAFGLLPLKQGDDKYDGPTARVS
jgi:hypothetical protein